MTLLTTSTKIGTVAINWTPTANETISLANVQLNEIYDDHAAARDLNASASTSPNQFVISGSQLIVLCCYHGPEPASLGVLALGGVALLARRKKA